MKRVLALAVVKLLNHYTPLTFKWKSDISSHLFFFVWKEFLVADYDEVRHILHEAQHEDEVFTTIGEIELPAGEDDPSPLVRLVVKDESGEPVVMTGKLLSKNDHFRETLVHIGDGFSEFSFDCPALLISISSEVEAA